MTIQEIDLTIGNRPGALRQVAELLAEGRINVAALSVSSEGPRSFVKLVVSDTEKALWMLRKAGYKVDAYDLVVVQVEDKAGSFLRALDVLAKHKVNVTAASIMVTRQNQRVLIGVAVDNPNRARKLLAESGFLSTAVEGLVTNADLVAGGFTGVPTESVGLLL